MRTHRCTARRVSAIVSCSSAVTSLILRFLISFHAFLPRACASPFVVAVLVLVSVVHASLFSLLHEQAHTCESDHSDRAGVVNRCACITFIASEDIVDSPRHYQRQCKDRDKDRDRHRHRDKDNGRDRDGDRDAHRHKCRQRLTCTAAFNCTSICMCFPHDD